MLTSGFQLSSRSTSCRHDHRRHRRGIVGGTDHDLVAKLRDRFKAATDALDECDRAARMERGHKPSLLLYRVVCVDEDTTLWPACDFGNLRLALNTLVRAFEMRD